MATETLEPKPRPTLDEAPKEIWALWSGYHWVPPIDTAGNELAFLAFDNEASAKESAGYHNSSYTLNCWPVRLK